MSIIKRLSGRSRAGRGVTVLPDDTFLVSYPRSGNTWARFLIGNLIASDQGPTDFLNIEKRVPDIYQNSDADLLKVRRPRILKSHEFFDPRYKRIVYLVRNPVHVAASYLRYMRKVRRVADDCPMETFLARFLDGTLDSFGTWQENVGSWLGARRGSQDFLLLRYEDLVEDTESNLRAIACFLGIEATAEQLSRSLALASAGRMQDLERAQAHQWRPLKNARQDIDFVRSASSERGADESRQVEEHASMLRARWHDLMQELGY